MKPIEELRAQRTLIQNHLKWLDDQIRQAELTEPTHPSPENHTQEKNPPEQAVDQTEPASVGSAETTFIQSSNASDIKTAQVGCLVLFAALTLLFLFLLFGLPYLLD